MAVGQAGQDFSISHRSSRLNPFARKINAGEQSAVRQLSDSLETAKTPKDKMDVLEKLVKKLEKRGETIRGDFSDQLANDDSAQNTFATALQEIVSDPGYRSDHEGKTLKALFKHLNIFVNMTFENGLDFTGKETLSSRLSPLSKSDQNAKKLILSVNSEGLFQLSSQTSLSSSRDPGNGMFAHTKATVGGLLTQDTSSINPRFKELPAPARGLVDSPIVQNPAYGLPFLGLGGESSDEADNIEGIQAELGGAVTGEAVALEAAAAAAATSATAGTQSQENPPSDAQPPAVNDPTPVAPRRALKRTEEIPPATWKKTTSETDPDADFVKISYRVSQDSKTQSASISTAILKAIQPGEPHYMRDETNSYLVFKSDGSLSVMTSREFEDMTLSDALAYIDNLPEDSDAPHHVPTDLNSSTTTSADALAPDTTIAPKEKLKPADITNHLNKAELVFPGPLGPITIASRAPGGVMTTNDWVVYKNKDGEPQIYIHEAGSAPFPLQEVMAFPKEVVIAGKTYVISNGEPAKEKEMSDVERAQIQPELTPKQKREKADMEIVGSLQKHFSELVLPGSAPAPTVSSRSGSPLSPHALGTRRQPLSEVSTKKPPLSKEPLVIPGPGVKEKAALFVTSKSSATSSTGPALAAINHGILLKEGSFSKLKQNPPLGQQVNIRTVGCNVQGILHEVRTSDNANEIIFMVAQGDGSAVRVTVNRVWESVPSLRTDTQNPRLQVGLTYKTELETVV